ncbi:MAG: YjfB family protein [Burkholderiales bacterium]|nr:YjfB family protein [Burkholderiales bacterium]MDE2452360.1 YjfB family protein [Burkholderiales bacterium]
MDPISSTALGGASSSDPASEASVLVLKKAINLQAANSLQLLQALPQPALASSGNLGTQVNTFA